jgi:hypothetical protein
VYELRPAVLLGLSAGAAMAAAAAESPRLAAGVPGDLKARTMALAADQDPGAVAHRAIAGDRAGPFGRLGFPGPLPNPGAKAAPLSSPRRRTFLAAAAVLVVAVGAVAFSLSSGPSAHMALADGKTAPAVQHASSADPATSSGGLKPSTAASATPAAHSSSATATPSTEAPSGPAAAPTTTTPAAQVTTTPPVAATLSVSLLGSAVSLQPGAQITVGRSGARLSLKADSGPVSWSITASGGILVWPRSSGTLAAGSSTSMLIASVGKNVPGATLTINPGGASYPLVVNSGF